MSISGTKFDRNNNPMAVNEKLIDAIKAFQYVPDPFKALPSDNSKSTQIRKENDKATDGVYCKAEPGSDEWKQYQSARLKSIKVLRQAKKQPLNYDTNDQSQLPTILKRGIGHKSRSRSASSGESIRWKEPVDDNVQEVAKVLQPRISGAGSRKLQSTSVPKRPLGLHAKTLPGTKQSLKKSKELRRPSKSKLEVKGMKSGPPNTSSSKGELKSTTHIAKSTPSSKTRSAANLHPKSTAPLNSPATSPGKRQPIFGQSSRLSTAAKIPRPKFPDIGVCNALPGTPEWDKYWVSYTAQMAKYNLELDEYRQGFKGISKELGGFVETISENTMANDVFRMKMGMKPGANKPPLLRHPITEPMTLVGGYTVRKVKNTKSSTEVCSVFITTFDHLGFRLEIEYPKLVTDLNCYSIKTDEDYNLIIVSLYGETRDAASEEIHIGVPMGKSAKSVNIGSPLDNGDKIVITTTAD